MTDWEGPRQRPQHLATELSRRHRVLYVRPWPISRSLRGRASRLPPVERVGELIVARPTVVSPGRLRPFAALNERTVAARVRRLLQPDRATVLWLSHPDQQAQIGRWDERLVCFDSMDYHPGFKTGCARVAVAKAERRLLGRADLVFTSSSDLQDRALAVGARATLVPNAVDWERFAVAALRPLAAPPELNRMPRPRLLFYGTVGPWRAWSWVATIARMRPDWTVVLIGGIPGPTGAELGRLLRLPNVHHLGPRPYASLPGYLQHADVCLLPLKGGEQTRAMDPVKVYEYLAAGKPVIATPLPELAKYGDLVDIAPTPASAVVAIERHLRAPDDGRRQARAAFVAGHTWQDRAAAVDRALQAALADRRLPRRA